MNEADHLSIPSSFVLAQQKISNLSEDLKIVLWFSGDGSGRVCWIKDRGLCFYGGKTEVKRAWTVVEQQDRSRLRKGTKSWIALSAKGWHLPVKEKGDDLW